MEVIPQSPHPLCHIWPQTLDREPCVVCQALSTRLNSRLWSRNPQHFLLQQWLEEASNKYPSTATTWVIPYMTTSFWSGCSFSPWAVTYMEQDSLVAGCCFDIELLGTVIQQHSLLKLLSGWYLDQLKTHQTPWFCCYRNSLICSCVQQPSPILDLISAK